MATLDLRLLITAIDRATAPLRAVARAIGRMADLARQAAGRITDAFGRVAGALAGLGAAAAGVAYVFNDQFLGPAREFERLRTELARLEGGSEAAEASLRWIAEFSRKTPFQLTEVADAFRRFRNQGMDPRAGLLEAAGDTAAAQGKRLEEVVEAYLDAARGEFERLKELGIVGSRDGGRATFSFGSGQQVSANLQDPKDLLRALQEIARQRDGGAMEGLSRTFDGMVSNLIDSWEGWKRTVMDSGPFQWLTERLAQLLAEIERLNEDGTLQRWAQAVADALMAAFKAIDAFLFGAEQIDPATGAITRGEAGIVTLWNAIRDGWAWIEGFVTAIGGWQNVALLAGAIIAGPLLAAIAALGQAIVGRIALIVANPIGAMIAAGVAVAIVAATWLYENWAQVTAWLQTLWAGMPPAFHRAGAMLGQALDWIVAAFRQAWAWIQAAWGPVKAWFGRLFSALGRLFDALGRVVTAIVGGLVGEGDNLKSGWGGVELFFELLWAGIVAIVEIAAELLVALIDLLAGIVDTLMDAWDGVPDFFDRTWRRVVEVFEWAAGVVQPIIEFFEGAIDLAADALGLNEDANALEADAARRRSLGLGDEAARLPPQSPLGAAPLAPPLPSPAGAAPERRIRNEIDIRVTPDGRARIDRLRAGSRDTEIDADVGPALQGAF